MTWNEGTAVGALPAGLPEIESIDLTVEYRDEPPVLVQVEWGVDEPPVGPDERFAPPFVPHWLFDEAPREGSPDHLPDYAVPAWPIQHPLGEHPLFGAPSGGPKPISEDKVDDLFTERRNAMDLQARAACFFYELDRRTDAKLSGAVWAMRMTIVQRVLAARIAVRAHFSQRDQVPHFGELDADTDEPRSLEVVSDLFLELAENHLSPAGCPPIRGFSGDPFDWAFVLFVSGRLAVTHPDEGVHRVLLTHGAPTSHLFLMFAELALLCIENSAYLDASKRAEHIRFWRSHLFTLVCTAQVLIEHPIPPESRPPSGATLGYYDGMSVRMADVRSAWQLYSEHLENVADREEELVSLFTFLAGCAHQESSIKPDPGEYATRTYRTPRSFRERMPTGFGARIRLETPMSGRLLGEPATRLGG